MGEQAFFQIAVALIPLLTFGGVLISRPQKGDRYWPPPVTTGEIFEFVAIFLLGLFAIMAEAIAIRGAVTGHTDALARLAVIAMILIGMVAIVTRATAPTISRILNLTRGTKYARKHRWGIAVLAALTIGSTVITIEMLNTAVRLGEGEARLRRIDRLTVAIEASYRRLDAIHRRENAILLKQSSLSTEGANLSRAKALEQRILTAEYKAVLRAKRIESDRLVRLVQQQNDLYAHAIPP